KCCASPSRPTNVPRSSASSPPSETRCHFTWGQSPTYRPSETGINRFAFESEDTENALVDAAKRFLSDETFHCLNAQSKLAKREGTLRRDRAAAKTLQIIWQQIFRAVNNSQILRAAAFDRGLRQASSPASNEAQGLHHHSFSATTGQFFPPASGFFNARCIGYVNLFVRCSK